MKKLLFYIGFLIILLGCSKTYVQVFNIEHNTEGFKPNSPVHIFENDTIRITYNFWGKNGELDFSIFNKTSRPIYVDWKNSFFIVNGKKLNYWNDETITQSLSLYSDSYYYGYWLFPTNAARLESQKSISVKPERKTVIPPLSYFQRSMFSLFPEGYAYKMSKNATVGKDSKKTPKEDTFLVSTSPYTYRNFISFSFSEKNDALIFIDNGFYIKSIIEMPYHHYRGKVVEETETSYIYSFPYKANTSFYSLFVR